VTNYRPARTLRSIPASSSFLGQQGWSALDDPAVSYRHAFMAAAMSSSLVPLVRTLQANLETLERERDALLRGSIPDYFVIPLPPAIEVRGRVTEVKDAVFLFFDDDD
jgi:hypothetical protein